MQNDERDLRDRTKRFALSVIGMFSMIPDGSTGSGKTIAASLRELEETAYLLELLIDGKIVPPKLLAALRQECDELIAIFVTILKRSKEPFETS